jgi:hypothetical protein
MVFCAGCLLLPVCGAVITAMKMSVYGPRMSLISLFGLVVGLPLLIDLAGARKVVGIALFAAMAGNAAMVAAQGAMRLRGREAPYPAVAEFRRLIPEPHPDIVVPETNVFLPLVETNRNDPENSLVYLFDTAKQLAVRGSDTPDVASRIIQGRSRARILPLRSLRRHSFPLLLGLGDGREGHRRLAVQISFEPDARHLPLARQRRGLEPVQRRLKLNACGASGNWYRISARRREPPGCWSISRTARC